MVSPFFGDLVVPLSTYSRVLPVTVAITTPSRLITILSGLPPVTVKSNTNPSPLGFSLIEPREITGWTLGRGVGVGTGRWVGTGVGCCVGSGIGVGVAVGTTCALATLNVHVSLHTPELPITC